MSEVKAKCFKIECNKPAKYYCCDPNKPACDMCSDDKCENCQNYRNTPLKSLKKSQLEGAGPKKCYKCFEYLKNDSVSSQCGHDFCLRCTAKAACQNMNIGRTREKEVRWVECACKEKGKAFIDMFLTKYCFCCGEILGEETIQLAKELKLRKKCLKIIREQGQAAQNKCFLKKNELEKMVLKCQHCSHLLYEDKKYCPACQNKVAFIKKSLKKDKEKTMQETPQLQKAKSLQNQGTQQQIPLVQTRSEMKYQEKRCINCHDILTRQDCEFSAQISSQLQFSLCKDCYQNQSRYSKSVSIPMKDEKKSTQDKLSKDHLKSAPQEFSRCLQCNEIIFDSISATREMELGGNYCSLCLAKQFNELERSSLSQPDRSFKSYQPEKFAPKHKSEVETKENKVTQGEPSRFGRNMTIEEYSSLLGPDPLQRSILKTIVQSHPDEVELFIVSQAFMSCFDCGYFVEEGELIKISRGKVCLNCFIVHTQKKP